MRLYPPVWSIGRIVKENYNLGEYTIPKDSALFMSQYVMHRDPRFYKILNSLIQTDGQMILKYIYLDLPIFLLVVD